MEWWQVLLICIGALIVYIILNVVFYKQFFKRFYDITLSVLALIILGIPLLIVALMVKIKMGSPVLFRQRRIGKGNREFYMLKFRTMTEARDEKGVYLPDTERNTNLGLALRRSSIDELPSLLNIIKGDMSIIGPRPLPVRYLQRYTTEQLRRHEVRPGLSNPATTNGRNSQSWENQFAADVWYANHISLLVDVKSIFDTVKVVFSHKGATADDGDARGEFIGTADVNELSDADGNYMKI
ncbi:MAG: sugar transferase [Candidatus Izemoplasmatales bacterium]